MPTTKEEKLAGWLSVTEVLDTFIPKGLLDWYLKTGKVEAKRIGTIAMKIGSRVDELIQQDCTVGDYKLSPKDGIEVRNCMKAWGDFKRDYEPKIQAVQVEVKDEANKLIGHIDLVMNDRVVDIKCASSIKDNYWLQVAQYESMYESDFPFLGLAILRLDKNLATYQFMTHEQAKISPAQCRQVFDGLLNAHRFYNKPKGQEEV